MCVLPLYIRNIQMKRSGFLVFVFVDAFEEVKKQFL